MCERIFIPVLTPVLVPLPPLPPLRLRVRDDAQTQWRIRANRSQWGLGLNMVTEHGQFLDGGRKVMSSVQQLSQPLYTIHTRGGRFILSKKNISAEVFKGPKMAKKRFFYNLENP